MKKFIIMFSAFILVMTVSIAFAVSNRVPAKNTKSRQIVVIPAHAAEVADHVFSLGSALDPQSGRMVEGYAIIRYKKGHVKPSTECGNGICDPGENINKCPQDCGGEVDPDPETSSCYEFLARDTKWKNVENYMVDPTNNAGLDAIFIKENLALDIQKWEDAANYNILGSEVSYTGDGADTLSPDGRNEVVFGNIEDSNAIGVTIVWGIFGGRPSARYLAEWDQIYNDVDFAWSATGEAGKMDFESIATHELGHSVGMGDLYTADCNQETMYGYASEGETNKRDLNIGDITGIQKLY